MLQILKTFPKSVWLFFFISFIAGIEFIGPFLIPFYKDWGHLDQLQIQILQSWFMLWIFLLEVPTGLIGDVKGRKYSVIFGYALMAVGALIYGSFPNFYVFLFAEFVFAMGVSFNSGAEEALMYDTLIDLNLKDKFAQVANISENIRLSAMLLASAFAVFLSGIPYNLLFQFSFIPNLIIVILIVFLIKEPNYRGYNNKGLAPNYVQTFKVAAKELWSNSSLKRILLNTTLIATGGYFTIWLFQTIQLAYSAPAYELSIAKTWGLFAQIIFATVFIWIIARIKAKANFNTLMGVLVAVGYIVVGIYPNVYGLYIFLTLSMGVGLKHRVIVSKFVNDHISSENRATVLSFVSMFRRIVLVVINPLVGYFMDKHLYITLVVIGAFVLIGTLVFRLKNEDFVNTKARIPVSED